MYGCSCSDQIPAVVLLDQPRKEIDIDLLRNYSRNSSFIRSERLQNSSERDKVKPFLKDYANFKPSLTEKVKEVLSKLPKFETTDKTDQTSPKLKGPIQSKNKTVYVGNLNERGNREGYGILYFPDGGLYEGYFRNDKMSGKGRMINAEGDYYEGEFLNDKANNIGSYVSADGVVYNGGWKEDLQHGYGEEVYLDGSMYSGNFEYGKKNGKGKFSWIDGSYYEGQFSGNNIEGKGTYQFMDNRVYKGEWKDNKMDGIGVFLWEDNKKYIGEYKNDKKDGFGIFIWPDGRRYEGGWHNGKQHGYGSMMIEGEKKYGEWRFGNRIRWLDENSEHIELINKVRASALRILSNENLDYININSK